MRRIATRAPDTFDEVASQMEVSLASLRENSAFKSQGGIATVGKQLCRDDIGRLVVAEFSHVFGAAKDMENNRIFQRAGETNTSHEVVSRLTRESGLAGPEFHELTNTLGTHEEMLDNLLSDYFFSGKPMEIVQTQCRQNVDQAAAKCRSGDAGAQVALLTNLAACYTFVRCGKDLFNASWEEQKERIVKPHKAQILSIFRLLSLHKRGKSSMITWMANKWREITVSQTPNQSQDNHLVEILTGEGKCLTLGLLAAFLAKSGTPCDVVCYRKALKEQDLNAMSPFYQFLGVASSIRYATFDELCQDRLEAIKHASKKLMLGEQISGTALLQDNSARALLIDEVDVFFGRRFYGKTWDAGFRFDTAEAKDLVRVIFDAMCKKRPIRDVTSEASFQALLSKTPVEMHQALEVCASSLVQNFEDWSTPEPILNASTGRIGYKENDEVNPDLSYSNKTVFAYLSFEMEGKLTPEQADSQIGMDIFCGRFSFAELPKQYSCILGVTGTLKPLLSFGEIKTILREEYGFKHTTYAPSIFGERNLTFKEAEHVKVLDNEADWLSRLEGLVEDERKKKNAVLVFFKNEAALKKYRDWSSCVVLTERVEPHRRNGYIAAASQPGQVTLLTRAFGRGIDFQMPNESELVVFQTFLSSLVSEETQIKGRTARQGKPGQYRLILCKDHLESKFGFTEEDIQVLKSGSGEQIKAKLAGKQQIKTIAKTAGMRQRKDRAALLEKETRAWEEMLFDPASSATQKLTKLAAWNYDEMKHLHYIVLLDNSGSMGGSRWQQLTSAVQSFKQELMRDAVTASATKVTFILFNHAASIIEPAQAKPSELQDIAHMMSGGGTDFSAAFSACHEAISHSGSACPVLILFLTDGGAPSPRAAVESLLADHSKNIKGLTCVAFAGAGQGRLNEIGKQFVDQSIDFKLKGADDEASLVETFVAEAAASRAIHT